MTRILGVIPARGGSVRIPRKNLQSVGGMTLVERAIECAERSELLTTWCLSTDSPEIEAAFYRHKWLRLTYPNGLPMCLLRKCGPDGPMVDVLRDALEQVGGEWDAVVTIQPTSPLRTSEDIDDAIRWWIERETGDACVTTNEETGERNGAVYVTPVRMIRDGLVFDPEQRWNLTSPMPASRSLDVNVLADLEEARRILGP